jgi:hypothetical protein
MGIVAPRRKGSARARQRSTPKQNMSKKPNSIPVSRKTQEREKSVDFAAVSPPLKLGWNLAPGILLHPEISLPQKETKQKQKLIHIIRSRSLHSFHCIRFDHEVLWRFAGDGGFELPVPMAPMARCMVTRFSSGSTGMFSKSCMDSSV